MTAAIMQPYFFPYIGYFQLIDAVDNFIFLDDVSFIKKGWIHRNRILSQEKEVFFSIPLYKVSQNRKISDTLVHPEEFMKWKGKFLLTLEHSYKKAPFFEQVFPLIEKVLAEEQRISELAINSILSVTNYLGIEKRFFRTSTDFAETTVFERADRLIEIVKQSRSSTYINLPGGKELYHKDYFSSSGIDLHFLKPTLSPYDQGGSAFTGGLSIIDVLMNNSRSEVREQVTRYTLE